MAAHVGSVDVGDRNVEPRAGAANFLSGSDDCFSAAQQLAHAVSAGNVPKRSALEFTCGTDDGAFAVTFDPAGIATQGRDEIARHFKSKRFQVVHKAGDVRNVAPGK